MTTNEDYENPKLSSFEKRAPERARHRALIAQLLKAYPGLTVQGVTDKFKGAYGYGCLVDNRLREMRASGWVESRVGGDGFLHWYLKELEPTL